jgi:hypothetical protein
MLDCAKQDLRICGNQLLKFIGIDLEVYKKLEQVRF